MFIEGVSTVSRKSPVSHWKIERTLYLEAPVTDENYRSRHAGSFLWFLQIGMGVFVDIFSKNHPVKNVFEYDSREGNTLHWSGAASMYLRIPEIGL